MGLTRREFLGHSLAGGAGVLVLTRPAVLAADAATRRSPAEKMGIAGIGTGGQGEWDILGASKGNEVVALCDVDFGMGYRTLQRFPKAKRYADFRKMLEEMWCSFRSVRTSRPFHRERGNA